MYATTCRTGIRPTELFALPTHERPELVEMPFTGSRGIDVEGPGLIEPAASSRLQLAQTALRVGGHTDFHRRCTKYPLSLNSKIGPHLTSSARVVSFSPLLLAGGVYIRLLRCTPQLVHTEACRSSAASSTLNLYLSLGSASKYR